MLDFLHAGGDREGGVERDVVFDVPRRKILAQLGHEFFRAVRGLEGVGAWELIDRKNRGGLAFEATDHVVGLRTELDARDVADPDHRAVGIGADDDVAEVGFRDEAALCADAVGEFLAGGNRLRPDLAGGIHGVLLLDGLDDFGNGDVALGENIGVDPEPHRILARAEDGHAGDAVGAGERIVEVDVGVVGEEDVVVGVIGRIEGEKEHRGRG